jgi:drug/metabolite transporter (DMT)-like permease
VTPSASTSPATPGAGLAALSLVFNAFVWGVAWWPFRQLHDLGLHPLWATVLIYLVATVVLAVARPAALVELGRHPSLWLLMAAAGTTNAAFNWAVTTGDVVRVVLLVYLMPLWAVLLARLLLHEALSAAAIARVVLALAGAALVLWPAQGLAGGGAVLGVPEALGLLAGFTFALNNVLLRREVARSDAARALAMFGGGVVVAGALALGLAVAGTVAWPPAPAPGWVAGTLVLGAVFIASNLTLQYGATRLPANTTAVIMLTEVVFAAASAFALGAGTLTPQVALGGLLIVAAALLAAVSRR